MERFAAGVSRFLIGLAKKLLLANNLGQLWDIYKAMPLSELTVVGAWMGVTAFAFQIYFDFSGYSDMAIGLGRMFGFEFMENFNYPYISKSITEFGDGGISLYPAGSASIYIFPWAAIDAAREDGFLIFWSYGLLQESGMEQAGTIFSGDCIFSVC
jgi:hypothetical protein